MSDLERLEAFNIALNALMREHGVLLKPNYRIQEAQRNGNVTLEIVPEIQAVALPLVEPVDNGGLTPV